MEFIPCPKIDTHLHLVFRPENRGKTHFSTYAEMGPHLEALNISKGILMSAGELLPDFGDNQENMDIVNADPAHYAWMCNPEPIDPDTVYETLKQYKSLGAVGVGELMCNRPMTDPSLRALFDAAGQLGLPITLHMSPAVGCSYGVVDEPGLPLLERSLHDFSDTVFVGHSACFWCQISADAPTDPAGRNGYPKGPVTPGGRIPELLEKYPNLYCDLSATSGGQAILRDEKHGLSFLERFSARMLFATDMCRTDMEFPLGRWLDKMAKSGDLSMDAYRKICRENAIRLYHL